MLRWGLSVFFITCCILQGYGQSVDTTTTTNTASTTSPSPPKLDSIEVYTMPVGEGDGTVILCPDGKTTILDMGNAKVGTQGIKAETFIEKIKIVSPQLGMGSVENIFLTHADFDHVSFTNTVLKEIKNYDEYKKVDIYIGGHKKDYTDTNDRSGKPINFLDNNVYEARGLNDMGNPEWYGCGYWYHPATTITTSTTSTTSPSPPKFIPCEWVRFGTTIPQNNYGAVNICTGWQLTLMTGNINIDLEHFEGAGSNMNSLVMKLTPDHSSNTEVYEPSMLFLGDFENEGTKDDSNYELLIEAAKDFYRDKTLNINTPQLNAGLKSNALMIPHHGAETNGNGDKSFFKEVCPNYSVISSSIIHSNKHPKYSILKNLDDAEYECRNDGRDFDKMVFYRDSAHNKIDQFQFAGKEGKYNGLNIWQTTTAINIRDDMARHYICTVMKLDSKGNQWVAMSETDMKNSGSECSNKYF